MNQSQNGNQPEAQPETQEKSTVEDGLATGPQQDAYVAAGEIEAPVGAATGEFPVVEAAAPPLAKPSRSLRRGAFMVGAGILLSRIVGLLRQRVFAYYFGTSAAKDAFDAAFRIPNFLQNVFGEGALSASFIPVYAKLLARGEDEEADRVASVVFSILALVTSVVVIAGIFAAPLLTDIVAAGFEGEKRDLTVRLVRILFPGAGLLVLSAWCLGVLNSHRRFFLSYTAPVIWNVAIIATLVWFGSSEQSELAVYAAAGAVAGSVLQFGIQLPTVLRLIRRPRLSIDTTNNHVRSVVRNFFPVFVSRGVVQISAFVDEAIASFLGNSAVAALTYTLSIYTLPVSLFGMSVSAAELPEMSSALGGKDEVAAQLRSRLSAGLRQISFFIVPSVVAMLALGDVMIAALYQTGRFTSSDTRFVWAILAGASIGLLPTTLGRLYSSTFYALHDTRTPFRFAILHVVLAIALGYPTAMYLPQALGIEPRWGVVGLTASAGIAGWVEFILLRRKLNAQIGRTGLSVSFLLRVWLSAAACAGVAWVIKLALGVRHPIILAALVLVPYGLLYFGITALFGIGEARRLIGRFTKFLPSR
jgi:putative peptidoglycan lipid II flippase